MLYTVAMRIKVRPVGTVENGITQNHKFDAGDTVSRIILKPRYGRALDGIESFSHIVVLFWLHEIKSSERAVLKVHPRRDASIPLTGVFATRSPVRPNPIGMTVVTLIKKEGNILTVKGLDAIDGTPVLDIKPYIPDSFAQSEIKVASWSKK
ncbi:MAG: tRNA (N6-threonylcarbamoyladenosine(37)-N6)-methyltransferase TrmO [Chloroflexi bacterium]|nr:tRNA (N6-threonylcarbamoyladenosine(37)-N6)-methyltransferase TrmO [Chloroflexota bacterium]